MTGSSPNEPDSTPFRPLRVGIWSCYSDSPIPARRLDIFGAKLIAGLLSLGVGMEVYLLASYADQKRIARKIGAFLGSAGDGLHFLPDPARRERRSALEILGLPLRLARRAIRCLPPSTEQVNAIELLEVARRARCDVWIFPSICCSQFPTRDFPSILILDEVVVNRISGGLPPALVDWLTEHLPIRAADATLCAYLSAADRNSALADALPIPPPKLRRLPLVEGFPQPVFGQRATTRWVAVLQEAMERQ